MIQQDMDNSVTTQEVEISAGISPENVEEILSMIGASGLFSPDEMASAESMAWDSAYGDGSGPETFLKATVNEEGQETIIGFICFGPIQFWPGDFEHYALAVDPQFQRLGIGSALLSEMREIISYEGGNRIFLETKPGRAFESARIFCEANYFVHEQRYMKQLVPENGGLVYRYDLATENAEDQHQ